MQEVFGTDDDINQWNQDWNGTAFWNMKNNREGGVGILINNRVVFSVVSQKADTSGRILALELEYSSAKHKINLVNVYAPSGGSSKRERKEFFNSLSDYIVDDPLVLNVLAGDFNCITNTALDCSPPRSYKDYSSTVLRNAVRQSQLEDIWRTFHPDDRQFTFTAAGGSQSRVDHIYTSRLFRNNVVGTEIEPFPLAPDHCMVYIKLCLDSVARGRGLWKLNTSLLEDKTYCDAVRNYWTRWREQKQFSNAECVVGGRQTEGENIIR